VGDRAVRPDDRVVRARRRLIVHGTSDPSKRGHGVFDGCIGVSVDHGALAAGQAELSPRLVEHRL
jgi:hypothetical protein